MAMRRVLKGLIALVVVILGCVVWVAWALVEGQDTLGLAICVEVERPPVAAVCRQALYRWHPTPEEVRTLDVSIVMGQAAEMPDEAEARRLIQHYQRAGVDINASGLRGKCKWTALHGSTLSMNPRAVRLLLEAGADPQRPDACGRTPVEWAKTSNTRRPDPAYAELIVILEQAASAAQR